MTFQSIFLKGKAKRQISELTKEGWIPPRIRSYRNDRNGKTVGSLFVFDTFPITI